MQLGASGEDSKDEKVCLMNFFSRNLLKKFIKHT